MTRLCVLLLCFLAVISASAWTRFEAPLVHVDGLGTLRGVFMTSNITQSKKTVSAFLGVPYAKPPVGDAGRWRLPQPHEPWIPGIRSAQEFGNACLSGGSSKGIVPPSAEGISPPPGKKGSQSEDCLMVGSQRAHISPHIYCNASSLTRFVVRPCNHQVNVFTPTGALNSTEKLPVMLWFHPGAYIAGDGNIAGENLVANAGFNVVLVSINYRPAPALSLPLRRLFSNVPTDLPRAIHPRSHSCAGSNRISVC